MKLKKLGSVEPEIRFGFEQLFFVLRRPLPFIGNDARRSRSDSRFARRSTRFSAFVQNLFPLPHSGLKPEFYLI